MNNVNSASENHKPFTTGTMAKCCKAGPGAVAKWVTRCLEELERLEGCDGRTPDQLRALYRRDHAGFIKTVKSQQLSPLTIASLITGYRPYLVNDDRRIPYQTVVEFCKVTKNKLALDKMGYASAETVGLVLSPGVGDEAWGKALAEQLDPNQFNPASALSWVQTGGLAERMTSQNGTRTIIVAGTGRGSDEARATGIAYGNRAHVIAVLSEDQDPATFEGYGFAAVIKPGGAISTAEAVKEKILQLAAQEVTEKKIQALG